MNAPTTPQQLQTQPLLHDVRLDDRYTLTKGRVLLTGAQALVRLTLLQAQRDRLAGLNTGGFVSGYRGSPLGGVDQAFWAAKPHLNAYNIRFQPGLNEDLAATSVWGSQQLNLYPDATVDGVFGLWYGKGPGVDRSLDVFKHANAAGTSPLGGVLLVAGDDHAAKSSTLPHQSDHVLKAALMPVLFPSSVQEILDFGLLGYAMSRYAAVWVGFKTVADVVECCTTVEVDPERQRIVLPTDFNMPTGGLNIRWPDTPLDQETRLLDHKLYAALAFCRANGLNRTVIDSPNARFGIVATGKAYQDTLQALRDLGLSPDRCAELGIRVHKVGMVWPLDAIGIRQFAQGLREILVVEEKRQLVEYQIKEELYAWRADVRPKVYGKFDERLTEDGREGGEWSIPQGQWLLPSHGELDPATVARAIARRLLSLPLGEEVRRVIQARLHTIEQREQVSLPDHSTVERKPYFCSGCPHNTSTVVPEGSRAMAGIGCHYMAVWMDRNTQTYTQMGGEGVPWIGQAPFTRTPHVFANLGDGTYFHSGLLAIRASVAAGVNITYKILYNDAVAMTGGQKLDGTLTVPQLTRQLDAEAVQRIVIVSDQPDRHRVQQPDDPMAPGVQVFDRRDLDTVQRTLREVAGTTVLIYEQTCASEKRRRRKRTDPRTGLPLYPNPARRVVINPRVCEGCGDCSAVSNCLSIEPLPTPWGVKRTINQSTCNKDMRCLEGLCPSLVTVEQAELITPDRNLDRAHWMSLIERLPEPAFDSHPDAFTGRYSILVNGVGGTGVVTIGAWLTMAAHIQGRSAQALDMAGLAQKGGAVFSHVQIAAHDHDLASPKIPVGEANLMLGGDLITSAHPKTLELLAQDARVVVNVDASPTADFIHQRDWQAPVAALHQDLRRALGQSGARYDNLHAQALAADFLGDSVYSNAMLLGFAWQKGWLPLHHAALRKAIELNAVQVENNQFAFELGRLMAENPTALSTHRGADAQHAVLQPETPSAHFRRLCSELVSYQNARFGQQFQQRMERLKPAFDAKHQGRLWLNLCDSYFRVLAFKDEYEVARLHSDMAWQRSVLDRFQAGAQLVFHLAPEWLAGQALRPEKKRLVKPAQPLFKCLAALKWLRGRWLDPFKNSTDCKNQQQLRQRFESLLELLQNDPTLLQNSKAIEDLLTLFDSVKGYGQVRRQTYERVQPQLDAALNRLKAPNLPD
ncbi:indolepyruvate ferredoxin oxidoreductase family protein [Limnobacter humi]|uniref:Indolepyruvate ferredoxin oxidoreductase family protein n=1 Tax=Limnobacter humi TaxID=1778671 RepID=A0ABT1WDI5_9BURK|nr:indolepyruvate ferredoxin oxidoreductase family protein [Limnobacter humi]MCQ8894923.1 indolepyruvate ferredoxin oxidoreductase family protein [Limnobacter humi]